ncbi:fatty acid synthase-like [Adelges cooleyi]|uniref:fatty acid synthase-like n=1 Tax=Adelges cooleyi TaxID=133065 RepID=UPI00217F8099|nr:fatty acid synthase-like [Adelges cooleyi]XP_050431819.1 fatty acid synthase-like [Adelges cooleyi]
MDKNKEDSFEVVISGVGGKFPKSENIEELKTNLFNKVNMVTSNDCRWNKNDWPGVPTATGKVSVAQKLDDTFIGINSRIVKQMDPLTRVLIERSFEAVIDAGLNPKSLNGSMTSVYTASCVSDSEAVGCDGKLTTPFWLLAHVRALLANRVSNILNLNGPSFTIDSSFIGGIEILRQAVEDVAKGRVKSALVGVTNIIWYPDMAKHWMGLDRLSDDGICRSFDENANGYGRSEGVVVLFLQRSTEALRSYGTVVHAGSRVCMEKALNLVKPTEDSLRDFYQDFYNSCRVSPEDVSYLEADGSGCKYYEEKELNAASEIFCIDNRTTPLPIGSVKSNLGHSEGASSLISVVKALIALDSGIIPPNINFQLPNQKINALKKRKMKVVTEPTKLDGPYVATTSLGLPSSIGHVLLKQNPKAKNNCQLGNSQRLVLLSSRTAKGLAEAIDIVKSMPRDDEYLGLIQNVFRENIVGHFNRGYVTLDTKAAPSFGLEENGQINRPVWFVFGGMGSQWPGMASDLMEIPRFAASVNRCDKFLKPIGFDIVDILTNPDPEVLKSKPVVSFLAIATMHIAFVDVLAELGIHPDGMFGHSLGENGCAYADGCFDSYGALMAAFARGKVAEFLKPSEGLMAAVGLSYNDLIDLPPSIDIGCHNSKENVTISGPRKDVEDYIEILKKRNVFVREVNSNGIAYHSRMVKRQAEFVKKFINKTVPNPTRRSSKWISTSVPESKWNSDLAQWNRGEYHANNFKSPVLFAEAIQKVPKNVVVIEIAPHGLFQGILKSELDSSCKVVSLAKRGSKSPLKHFLNAIGELYTSGLQVNLNSIYPQPEYPVSRCTPSLAPLVSWNHEETWPINTHYDPFDLDYVYMCLRDKQSRHLLGHKINDSAVVPMSFLVTEVLHSLEKKQPDLVSKSCQTVFENIFVHTPLVVSANESKGFYSQIQIESGLFEVISSRDVLMTGDIYLHDENHLISPEPPTVYEVDNETEWVYDNEVYGTLAENGIAISAPYNTIQKILVQNTGYIAKVIWSNDLNLNLNTMMQLKMFADHESSNTNPLLPSWFRSLIIDKEKMSTTSAGSMVFVTFNFRTNVIRGPGLELECLKTSVFQNICPPVLDLQIQKVQFVSQPNPNIQNFIQLLSACLQIVKDSKRSNMNLKIKLYDAKFTVFLRKLYEIQPYLKKDIDDYTHSLLENLTQSDVILLITEHLNNDLKQDIKKCLGRVFVLEKSTTVDEEYTTVIQKEYQDSVYHLITPSVTLPNQIMEVSTKHSSWKECMQQGLKFLTSNMPIVLVKIDSECPIKVVNEIEEMNNASYFRYIILSKSAPIFDLTNGFFREQLFKGLRQNILRGETWGSYIVLPCTKKPITCSKNIEHSISKLSELSVKYIGILKNEKIDEEECTQYSGIDKDGKNVMGILKYSSKSKHFEIDDVLKWYVRPEWSMEEAVKLPTIYSMAYYYLVILARVKSGNTIFVHDASSPIGQAFIRVALSYGCKLFVSTYNREQTKFVQEFFPQLSVDKILELNNNRFEVQLLSLTNYKGCRMVISSVPSKYLSASMRCVKKFGVFVHIGEQDITAHTKFGMGLFLKNIAMYGAKDLMHVVNSPDEIKTHLKELVNKGIVDGVVCKLNEPSSVDLENSNTTTRESALSIPSNYQDQMFVEKDKSYIVMGSTSNLWLKTVTWLLRQEVKRLIFVIDGTAAVMRRNQRTIYSLIQQHPDVSFIMTSAERFNAPKEGERLLRDLTSYSKIAAVFCIETSKEKLKNVDSACKHIVPDLKYFVSMQSDATEVCESRNDTNSKCINLQCDKFLRRPEAVFNCMNDLIESTDDPKPVAVIVSNSPDVQLKDVNVNDLTEFLPNSIAELLDLNKNLPDYPKFEKCISKGLQHTDKNSLLPVFIIPGLGIKRIQPLISKIMHPVFCAMFPPYVNTIENAALSLLWPLKQIQPQGPFTIIGETWGGNVAVELTKIIEGFGDTVNLILLDGTPYDNEKRLKLLDKAGFSVLDQFAQKEGDVAYSEDVLKNQLTAIRDFVPNDTQLAADTIIARPSAADILDTCVNFEKQHSGKLTVHISKQSSYKDFIGSLEIATIINENASFKW